VTPSWIKESPQSPGTAKRMRGNNTTAPKDVLMAVVACEQCSARFAICHPFALQDASLAERHAVWLADLLVWDHIQESKHPGSRNLPSLLELKVPATSLH
jgi:hypothetical protein